MFLAVVEHQGFTRAGEELHVSQSAVSKGVRELEHQLGLPLIEDRRGIRLTEAGEALLPVARSLFALERVATEQIDDRLRLRRGRLRIGASTTVAGYCLPPAMAAFILRYPGVAVELVVGNTGDIARAVLDCTTDIGFVEGPTDLPGLSCTPWQEDPMELLAGATHTELESAGVSGEALSKCTWLVREAGSGTRHVTDAFLADRGIQPARLVVLGSNEAIVRATADGAGLAILPRRVAQDLIETRRVRAVHLDDGHVITRLLYRIEFPGRSRTPALEAFLKLLGDG